MEWGEGRGGGVRGGEGWWDEGVGITLINTN